MAGDKSLGILYAPGQNVGVDVRLTLTGFKNEGGGALAGAGKQTA